MLVDIQDIKSMFEKHGLDEPGQDRNEQTKKAYQRAIDLLSRREHSYKELQQKLQGRLKGECNTSEIVIEVLDGLASKGLQSDERFTENYVRSRSRKGRGQLLIRNELHQRGVSDHLIGQYLNDQEQDWIQSAAKARQKRFGDLVPKDIHEKSKQIRFLQQRGFTHEQIRLALDER